MAIFIGQDDNTPRLPTKYWRWGESFTTFHRFDPAYNMLDYRVAVGWYIFDGLTYPKFEYSVTVKLKKRKKSPSLFSIPSPFPGKSRRK